MLVAQGHHIQLTRLKEACKPADQLLDLCNFHDVNLGLSIPDE